MGIVTPPRGSRGAAPFANKGGSGGVASGGIATSLPQGSRGAKPTMNGKSGGSLPGYGSAGGGPYDPTLPKQSTRSSSAPLH